MHDPSRQLITEVTRRAIFKAMRERDFPWWGQSSEADLLGRVFDLQSMRSNDKRQPDAAHDISMHRDGFRDWDNDWIFDDARLDLMHCPDATLLKLFETMLHPTIQPEREQVKWLVDILNLHLTCDGWRFEKVTSISGRPVYETRRRGPTDLADSPRYTTPDDVDIDLESILYSVSRLFAHRGETTEVAILADASAELIQIEYDNYDGGSYGYGLHIRI
jgi:AbiJ N-terminal domain 3